MCNFGSGGLSRSHPLRKYKYIRKCLNLLSSGHVRRIPEDKSVTALFEDVVVSCSLPTARTAALQLHQTVFGRNTDPVPNDANAEIQQASYCPSCRRIR